MSRVSCSGTSHKKSFDKPHDGFYCEKPIEGLFTIKIELFVPLLSFFVELKWKRHC